MRRKVNLGTRGSALALWQAEWVRGELARRRPDLDFGLVIVKTRGDRIKEVGPAGIGEQGLFVKELEEALLAGEIDLAVHSMKDVPVATAPGLVIGAVTERADPRDVLVSAGGVTLTGLPRGAKLGTSSLRRKAQLWHFRPDLILEDLRGNVPTRLARMRERGLDGIIVAAAGLERLNLAGHITQYLPYSVCLPAAGQGAIGLEVRQDDEQMLALAALVNHPPTAAAVTAERALLGALQAGCRLPVAAFGRLSDTVLHLEGLIASPDGKTVIRSSLSGSPGEARAIGRALAEELLHLGGEEILRQVRQP